MVKLVVLHKEKEFCKGVHVLFGPAVLEDLLNVDIFCMEETAEGERVHGLHAHCMRL